MLAGCKAWPEEFAARYREAGCWQGETFGELLRKRASAHGERVAVVCGDRRISYAELDNRVDRLAAGFLKLGIKAQERIIVQLPNIASFFDTIFALFRIGALPVFALPVHRRNEIVYLCGFSEAAAYIIPDMESGYDYRHLAAQVQASVPSLRHVIVAGDPGPGLSYPWTICTSMIRSALRTDQKRKALIPAMSRFSSCRAGRPDCRSSFRARMTTIFTACA